VRPGRAVRCQLYRAAPAGRGPDVAPGAIGVRVTWTAGSGDDADQAAPLPPDVAAAAAAAGIGVEPDHRGVTLTFAPAAPAAPGTSTNTDP
jgi:hypothetical protein